MLMWIWAQAAFAIDLSATLTRAAEVDPTVVIASLNRKVAAADTSESWTTVLPTPSWSTRIPLSEAPRTSSVDVDLNLFAPQDWLDISQKYAITRSTRYAIDATRLDVEHAAANLYYTAMAADAAVAAAEESMALADATVAATRARRDAGLDSDLSLKAAEIGALNAKATLVAARSDRTQALALLSRALQQEVDAVSVEAAPALPSDPGRSPWMDVAEADIDAARRGYYEELAGFLPTAGLGATTSITAAGASAWVVAIQAQWTLDGVLGPWFRARQGAYITQIAEVERDALEDDLAVAARVAREQARVALELAEVARAREALADEALAVGRSRLSAGLESTIDVLRLQDDAAAARSDTVAAELAAAVAVLEVRRLGGLPPR